MPMIVARKKAAKNIANSEIGENSVKIEYLGTSLIQVLFI